MDNYVIALALTTFFAAASVSCIPFLLGRIRQLESTARAAKDTLRHMQLSADQSPASILYVSPAGIVGYANSRFLELFGCTYNIVDKSVFDNSNSYLPEPIPEKIAAALKEKESWRGAIVIPSNTDVKNPVLGSVTPVFNTSGQVDHVLLMFEDSVSSRATAAEKLYHESNYSHLTLLPNRKLAFEEIQRLSTASHEGESHFALTVMDIDHFKDINDTFGIRVGDQILRRLGNRLAAIDEFRCFIAHLGGDKFALISSENKYGRMIKLVQQALSKSFKLGDDNLSLTACFGVAFYPGDAEDSFALLRNAEAAMYQAKSVGRNRVHYFKESLNQQNIAQFNTANQLANAIEKDELSLCYQPIITLHDTQACGFEVLLRWNNSILGNVSPDHFIAVAEDTGLINPIGAWVLNQACATAAGWQGQLANSSIAVNVSSKQFTDGQILKDVKAALKTSGLAPERLELEITEGLLLDDLPETRAALLELKQLGVQLSLDDFGTGYSSLSYLKRYPFDTLKIDRSFIKDIAAADESSALTLAMIAMAHSLGLKVVAEGIETMAQHRLLAEKGCDMGQGFLYSKPLAPSNLGYWLDNQPSPSQGANLGLTSDCV